MVSHRLRKLKDLHTKIKIFKGVALFLTWAYPFAIAAIPFIMFFNEDRYEWMQEIGIDGTDWN